MRITKGEDFSERQDGHPTCVYYYHADSGSIRCDIIGTAEEKKLLKTGKYFTDPAQVQVVQEEAVSTENPEAGSDDPADDSPNDQAAPESATPANGVGDM